MTSPKTLLALICLAAMMLAGIQTPGQTAEVVQFTSAVLPPTPFKLRQAEAQGKDRKPEPGFPLCGRLKKPRGAGGRRPVALAQI